MNATIMVDPISKDQIAPEEREWIDRNRELVLSTISRIASNALVREKEKKKRARKLLWPVADRRYPGDPEFNFAKFRFLMYSLGCRIDVAGLFEEEFLDTIELGVPEAHFYISQILSGDRETPYPTEQEIRARVGEGKALFLAQVCDLIANGFLDRRYWHVCHVIGKKGVRWLSIWPSAAGWRLCAVPIGYPDEMSNGGRYISHVFDLN